MKKYIARGLVDAGAFTVGLLATENPAAALEVAKKADELAQKIPDEWLEPSIHGLMAEQGHMGEQKSISEALAERRGISMGLAPTVGPRNDLRGRRAAEEERFVMNKRHIGHQFPFRSEDAQLYAAAPIGINLSNWSEAQIHPEHHQVIGVDVPDEPRLHRIRARKH